MDRYLALSTDRSGPPAWGLRRALLLLAFLSCGVPAFAQEAPTSLPIDGPELATLSVGEALDLVLAGALPKWDAQEAARRAGATGDAAHAPRLRQIAARYAPTYGSVAANALHALWELGEPRDYFLNLAQSWAAGEALARYAVRTLARDPDPAELALLRGLADDARTAGAELWTAVDEYEDVLQLTEAFRQTPTLLGRADLLFGTVVPLSLSSRVVTDTLDFNPGNPDGHLAPAAVWSRYALRGMARQQPDSVEVFLNLLDAALAEVYGPEQGPVIARDFGGYVAQEAYSEGPAWLPTPPLPDLPGALTLAGGLAEARFDGRRFLLSGRDHTLGGQPAPEPQDAHGALVPTAAAQQTLLGALPNDAAGRLVGAGGEADVAADALAFDADALAEHLLTLVTDTLAGGWSGTLGSAEAPVVAYAPDGLDQAGNAAGTGILIVDGAFTLRGRARWTGLVVLRAAPGAAPALDLGGNAAVIGGVLILGGADATLRLGGSPEVRYSRAAFERLRAAFDLPS